MTMWRQGLRQEEMLAKWPGHVFSDRLQAVLTEAGFDAFVEELCQRYYAPVMAAPSLPQGGAISAFTWWATSRASTARRGWWRCPDSLSLRDFLGLEPRRGSPMEANAAMRSRWRRDTGESYRAMLTRLAETSGIATPTTAELKQ